MTDKHIMIVEDDEILREALCDTLEIAGYSVDGVSNGQDALDRLEIEAYQLVVTDVQMQPMDGNQLLVAIKEQNPHLPVVMMTAYGTIEKAVDAMRCGALDYLVKPFEAEVLLDIVSRIVPGADHVEDDGDELIAIDAKVQSLKALAAKVALSEATVLLTGESGVGKEVFAQFIHQHSTRATGPYIAINCAAIPETMLEAVLFGYEKGAFTGAYQSSAGKFEQAQGGTLLLDEISEMDMQLQAKILRVLQEREVERLGGQKIISLNVRVIATTNKNLREEVASGRFREDLFYRLNVFPLHIAPLRERIADIIPIAKRIICKHSSGEACVPVLNAQAEQKLLSHYWAGNVRELDNVIQRALILRKTVEIQLDDIQFESLDKAVSSDAQAQVHVQAGDNFSPLQEGNDKSGLVTDLKDREQQLIVEALVAGKGSRKYAAERLGISPRTLRYKLAKMRDAGIRIPR